MKYNSLDKLVFQYDRDSALCELVEEIKPFMLSNIYSYLLYSTKSYFRLEFNVSETQSYNTISVLRVINEITSTIEKDLTDHHDGVIGFKQPSIELILELYKPLLNNLALKQSERWEEIPYDDAYQMACLAMFTLYNKGYYINKRLLTKTFNNDIYMFLRHNHYDPTHVSLSDIVNGENTDDEALTYEDSIADTNAILEEETKEDKEFIQLVFAEVKEMIIKKIGQRQFDELFRDYKNKHTTGWSRRKLMQLKKFFEDKNITWSYFDKYL